MSDVAGNAREFGIRMDHVGSPVPEQITYMIIKVTLRGNITSGMENPNTFPGLTSGAVDPL